MSTILKTLSVALLGLFLLAPAFGQIAGPTLVFPKHESVYLPRAVSFEWNTVPQGQAYHLQVSVDTNFTTTILDNPNAGITQTVSNLPINRYVYWRVRAYRQNDTTAWSDAHSVYLLTPRSLGNMQLWTRADSGVIGTSVGQWTDYSGNNVQLVQADATRKPTLSTAAQLNGMPVLNFDGTNDFLDGGQNLELRTNDQTIYIIFNSTNVGNATQYRLIQKRGHTTNTDGWCLAPRGFEWNSSLIQKGANTATLRGGVGNNDGNYRIANTVWDNSEGKWKLYVRDMFGNYTTEASYVGLLNNADITQNFNKIMTVGNSWNGNNAADQNFFLKGNIAEIMVYHTALDSAPRMLGMQYLRHKYTPPVNLGRDLVNHDFCNDTLKVTKPYYKYYYWYDLANPTVLLNSTDSTTKSTLVITHPGTYRVKVMDIFGFYSSDTIVVSNPEFNVPSDTSICYGDTVKIPSLLGSSYRYLWSNGDTTESLNITQTDTYFVRITYPGRCFVMSDTFHVNVDLFTRDATLGPDATFCPGNTLQLDPGADGVVDYLWSDSSTGPTFGLFVSDTYWVSATDTSGCVVIDTVVATVVPGDLPEIKFDADSVCFGTATQFNDSSTIDSGFIASYKWKFGDNATSTLQEPSHLYAAAGNYNVTLTAVSDIGCNSSLTKTIIVFATPTIDYFTNMLDSGCVGSAYAFIDSSFSTTPPDVVSQWTWDFGDGSPIDTQQSTTHTYGSVGTYQYTLDIATQHGCVANTSGAVVILDSIPDPKPFSLFSPAAGAVIAVDSITYFEWNISDDAHHYVFQLANDQDFIPGSIIYQKQTRGVKDSILNQPAGVYYWRVTAYNICGVEVTAASYKLTLFGNGLIPGMQLWLMGNMGILQDTANQSTQRAVMGWLDQSGNGHHVSQLDQAKQPSWQPNTFNGHPTVRFSLITGGGTFLLSDRDAVLNLGANDQSLFAIFTSNNLPNEQYRVIQKRGTPDQGQSYAPGWCLAARGQSLTPSIIEDATDRITLSGTTYALNNGCYKLINTIWDNSEGSWDLYMNGAHKEHNVNPATAGKTYNTNKRLSLGCAYNNSTNQTQFFNGNIAEIIVFDRAVDTVSRRIVQEYLRQKYFPAVNLGRDIKLNYGFCNNVKLDGGECRGCQRDCKYRWSANGSTNVGDTLRFYNAAGQGVYSVTVTDGFGFVSTDTIVITGGFNSVSFGDTVHLCMGDTLTWDTRLTRDGYTFKWQDNSTDSVFHITQGGKYYVYVVDTVLPINGGPCFFRSDTVTVVIDSFEVLASIGNDTLSLCGGNRIGLSVHGETAFQYLWNDGSTGRELTVFTTGDYSLTAANTNLCIMQDTVHVDIRGMAPDANFSFNRTCLNDTTFFTDLTVAEPGHSVVSWDWDFDDGSTDNVQHTAHFFANTALYDVTLRVLDDNACYQDVTKTVEVLKLPTANFTRDLVNCATDSVRFFNQSTSPAGQSITNYYWTFGDGRTSTDSNTANPFAVAGIYPIGFEVTTDSGCSHIIRDTIEIYPELRAEIGVGNLCFDKDVDFYDASPTHSNISWYWEFGDHIGTSTQKNPVYDYPLPGNYTIELQVKNAIGCVDTATRNITVTTRPTVHFSNPSVCDGAITFFNDSSTANGNDSIVSYTWNFGDQYGSSIQHPTHLYRAVGAYPVTLSVSTKNGCANSATKSVSVLAPPIAAFTFTPNYGPAPLPVTFTNTSQGGTDYIWNFGDNSALSTDISPMHTYTQDGHFAIKLVTLNAAGCSDTAISQLNVSLATLDIALDDITVEKIITGECSYELIMGAHVINGGTREVTSFDIEATHSLRGAIAEYWEGTFTNLEMNYQFHAKFMVHDCSEELVLCMEVKKPNGEQDENPSNNFFCRTLKNELAIVGPYPNPASDLLNLQIITPRRGGLTVTHFNAMGQNLGALQQGQVDAGSHQYVFDIEHQPAGIYMLKIRFNEEERIIRYIRR